MNISEYVANRIIEYSNELKELKEKLHKKNIVKCDQGCGYYDKKDFMEVCEICCYAYICWDCSCMRCCECERLMCIRCEDLAHCDNCAYRRLTCDRCFRNES
jgi:hypothetical protein